MSPLALTLTLCLTGFDRLCTRAVASRVQYGGRQRDPMNLELLEIIVRVTEDRLLVPRRDVRGDSLPIATEQFAREDKHLSLENEPFPGETGELDTALRRLRVEERLGVLILCSDGPGISCRDTRPCS